MFSFAHTRSSFFHCTVTPLLLPALLFLHTPFTPLPSHCFFSQNWRMRASNCDTLTHTRSEFFNNSRGNVFLFISIKIFSCYLLKWQFKEIRQADPTKIYKQWQNCLSKYGDIGANCLIGCCCLANQTRDETLLPPLATCGYVFLIHYFLLKSVLK